MLYTQVMPYQHLTKVYFRSILYSLATYSACVVLSCFGFTDISLALESKPIQDHHALKNATLEFVHKLPTMKPEYQIQVADLDTQLNLTACTQLSFAKPSSALEGNIRVRAECAAPEKWSLFLTVSILKPIKYFILTQSLDSNKILGPEDLSTIEEYRTHPAAGLADDLNRIVGLKLNHALKAGSAIRYSDLSSEPALSRGQKVKIIAEGKGYLLSQEGLLLHNTYEGQTARVQLSSKRIISGIAHKGGIVEVR